MVIGNTRRDSAWNTFDISSYLHYILPVRHQPLSRTRQTSGHVRQDGTSVAIVGGGGNVGSYLFSHLRSAGILVTAFDVHPNIAGMSIAQLHSNL